MKLTLPAGMPGRSARQSPWRILFKDIRWFLSLLGEVEDGTQRFLEMVATVGVDAESDGASGELRHVEDGAMVGRVKENRDLAGILVAHIVKQNDVERGAADAVAVVVPIDDVHRNASLA